MAVLLVRSNQENAALHSAQGTQTAIVSRMEHLPWACRQLHIKQGISYGVTCGEKTYVNWRKMPFNSPGPIRTITLTSPKPELAKPGRRHNEYSTTRCKLCLYGIAEGDDRVWLTKPMGLSHPSCAKLEGLI